MKISLLWLILFFLTACGSQLPTTTPIASLPTATATHTAAPTATATFTATPLPSPTFTPSAPNLVATSLLAIPTTHATRTLRPTYTPIAPTATPTPQPTATPAVLPPVDLSGASNYQGAVLSPGNVSNLQKMSEWGKGSAEWASYSPDGSQVAVKTNNAFYLYQAGSDTEIYTIPAPAEGWFISADISDDGQWLALGLNNEQIAIYTLADGAFQYQLLQKYADYLQFLPHSAILLTQEWGWNIATNQPVTTNFPGGVISADGQTVAYEAEEFFQVGQLTWENNILRFQPTQQIQATYLQLQQFALSPDGSKLAIASWYEDVEVWNTHQGVLWYEVNVRSPNTGRYEAHSKSRRFSPALSTGPGRYYGASVAFSPDGKLLVVNNGDSDLLFWEANSGRFAQRWVNAEKQVSFTADLTQTLSWGGALTEWTPTGQKLFEHPQHFYDIWDLAFLPSNNHLVITSNDLMVLNTPQLQPQARFDGPVYGLVLLDKGEGLLYMHDKEGIISHHLPTGRLTSPPQLSNLGFPVLTTSSDSQWLITRAIYAPTQVWLVKDWSLQLEIKYLAYFQFPSFTQDNQYLIIPHNAENSLEIWALQPDGAEALQLQKFISTPENWVMESVLPSPDSQLLLIKVRLKPDNETKVFVMDLQSESVVASLPMRDEIIFTPDGQLVIEVNNDQLRFWQTSDWSLRGKIKLDERIDNFSISADGRLLALVSGGHLELWGIPQ